VTAAVPRRILAVDHAGVLGGAEHSLLDILDALRPNADALLLADGPFREALERRGIKVNVEPLRAAARVRKGGIPTPSAIADTYRAARSVAYRAKDYDLLYANSQKAFVISAMAGWFSGKQVVWHLRDILGPPHFSATNSRIATMMANRWASLVIANSQATADGFVAAGGRASLVRVVHNGIDPAPFDAVTPDAAQRLRASLSAPTGIPLVVHVGRFHQWKGQQVLLRALAIEKRVHAWFVGAPLFGEEAFAAELRLLSTSLGLDDRVKFLGLRDDVPALLRAGDIVVHSSVYPEPFGRVVIEGMLAGKPVIASNAGGVTELIINERTGLLVTPDDPKALASAIGRVVDDRDFGIAIAAEGSGVARAQYTSGEMVRGVAAALATLEPKNGG
jgi:glycosyltransferase involved in cell wall biosynthesis